MRVFAVRWLVRLVLEGVYSPSRENRDSFHYSIARHWRMHCCRFQRRQIGIQYVDGVQHGE